jgi:gas vesicle protein
MSKGNVILGVLAGLAAGAILGVLFAPAKGSKTRRKISEKGEELADNLKRKFDGFLDGLAGEPDQAAEEDSRDA